MNNLKIRIEAAGYKIITSIPGHRPDLMKDIRHRRGVWTVNGRMRGDEHDTYFIWSIDYPDIPDMEAKPLWPRGRVTGETYRAYKVLTDWDLFANGAMALEAQYNFERKSMR